MSSVAVTRTNVSFAEMMAELILLRHHGYGEGESADDDESRAFEAEVLSRNRNWQPGTIPKVPAGYPDGRSFRGRAGVFSPSPRVMAAPAARPRERRFRRSQSSTARGDPDPEPEPPRGGASCGCGCGRQLPPPAATGRPRRFYDEACRQRNHRAGHERPPVVAPAVDNPPVTKQGSSGRLPAISRRELSDRVARARIAREDAESEAINERIRAEFAREATRR